MSWQDQALDGLIITTGDGREYRPLWREPKKIIEYNVAQFEFPDITGSIISRGTPKGRKIPLEIYFTGTDHLFDTEQFLASADDSRHWVVTHPYYGIFNAHPTLIDVDNTGDNVSKLMVNLIETIVEDNPKGVDAPPDVVLNKSVLLSTTIDTAVLTNIPVPNTLDKNLMQNNIDAIYNEGKKTIKSATDAENYLNLYNDATAAILNATDDVAQAMTTAQLVINAPFLFADTVKNRINVLVSQFSKLLTSVGTITGLRRVNDKRIYEAYGSLIVSTMAQASVTNIDYASTEEVLTTTTTLLDIYEEFITNLDTLQTDTGGSADSYVPDADSMLQLQDLINYTISKLLQIALDSKQERSLITEADTNIIILAHRLYGLQVDDSTIDYLIATNELGMSDMLQIPAGRKIKYYT